VFDCGGNGGGDGGGAYCTGGGGGEPLPGSSLPTASGTSQLATADAAASGVLLACMQPG